MLSVVFRPQAQADVLGIRRAVLHRFPYAVYFVLQGDAIVVLAVHGRQDPERWKSRANP